MPTMRGSSISAPMTGSCCAASIWSRAPAIAANATPPRDFAGGLQKDRWLAGAPNPEGQGRIPNITPGGTIGGWSESDIAYYLESGFTPEFDSVGGSMVDVQENMARLPASDREAIAAYLKAIPAVKGGP